MAKPRIIIADTDVNYIIPLQQKFAEEYFEMLEMEIITDRQYFDQLFAEPQKADILIISDELYSQAIQRHSFAHIFVMNEQYEEGQTANLYVTHIFKYTSIKEIFHEITGKSADALRMEKKNKQTQVVVVSSAGGGVGKTAVATGLAASLARNYKRVLYIQAAHLQMFQHMLENPAAIPGSEVYSKLAQAQEDIYQKIKYVIRKELFYYLPPFKAALMSMGLPLGVYRQIVISAQKSGEYDFIIVDTDCAFDDEKARLLSLADKVVIVTRQTAESVMATNILISNINGANSDKYIFVCNDFDKKKENALIDSAVAPKFAVSDYIEHMDSPLCPGRIAQEKSIQGIAYLII